MAREIEDEILIVPVTAGIGTMDDDLYTLNTTGKAMLKLINGERCLADITRMLAAEYDAPLAQILEQTTELISTLIEKGILIETGLK